MRILRACFLVAATALAVTAGAVTATGAGAPALAAQPQLDALIAEHRAIRAQLGTAERATLDRLTARLRAVLVGPPLRSGLWAAALTALKASGMQITDQERAVLATYALDGIAAMDDVTPPLEMAQASRQMQEMQMSFNLQYLQLQSKMQNETRRYALLSNIMKTKHDTVKNSISNVR